MSAEGIAALLEAKLLEQDADAIDPDRTALAITDRRQLAGLPERHPGRLRGIAAALPAKPGR